MVKVLPTQSCAMDSVMVMIRCKFRFCSCYLGLFCYSLLCMPLDIHWIRRGPVAILGIYIFTRFEWSVAGEVDSLETQV